MSDLKKHLLLTLEYPPKSGGVGVYLKNLVDNNQSYEFKVLKHSEQDKCSVKNLKDEKVVKCNFFYKYLWPKWLKIYFFLKNIYKKYPFQVLHISHILPLGYVAYLFSKTFNISYIIYLHGLDFNLMKSSKWKSYWGKKILSNAKIIVTNSEYLKGQVRDFINHKKIITIYPIPNKKVLQYLDVEQNDLLGNLKEKYNVNQNAKILLTVGRLIKRKGQHLVIEAMARLSKDYKYFIIGAGSEKKYLADLIKKYNLEKQVYILDNIKDEDLALFYKIADLFVMPTLKLGNDVEGFGIVYLEANAFSLPVIAGQGEGVKEAVKNDYNGVLLSEPNVTALTRSIKRIFNDQVYYAKLSKQAVSHYQKYLYESDYLFNKIDKDLL